MGRVLAARRAFTGEAHAQQVPKLAFQDNRICLHHGIAGRQRSTGTGNPPVVERFTNGHPLHAAENRSGAGFGIRASRGPWSAGRGCGARTAWNGGPWPAGWSGCPRGLWRGRGAWTGGQCRRPPRLSATCAGGRLVSTAVLLVATRGCGGRRRGPWLRHGRGRDGLCHLAGACRRAVLVLHQPATHPGLLGYLSPVRGPYVPPAPHASRESWMGQGFGDTGCEACAMYLEFNEGHDDER